MFAKLVKPEISSTAVTQRNMILNIFDQRRISRFQPQVERNPLQSSSFMGISTSVDATKNASVIEDFPSMCVVVVDDSIRDRVRYFRCFRKFSLVIDLIIILCTHLGT